MRLPNVTFVLPSDGPSGGVRVTVEMAQRLRDRGHAVRVVYRSLPRWEGLMDRARTVLRWIQGSKDFNWVHRFHGPKQAFRKLNEVPFSKGEIVIAVGEHVTLDVYELPREIIKVRYCHAIFDHVPELTRRAWSVPMPTLAVSESLAPELEKFSGKKVLAVVPNGINTSEYFLEEKCRDGLGLIFRRYPTKAPEETLALIVEARKRLPDVPWHLFGTSRRPKEFAQLEYWQYPAVEKARDIYNRCKVWLITSRHEGFCLPVLEAMACGCAVISSNHTVAADLIEDGVNGYIVPFGDSEAFLARIELLLRDESVRKGLVQNGFRTVQRFTWERAVAQMESVLEALAQGRAE
jgi:glycosyltransferase involved in cell wall biosynthesis